MKRMYFLLLGGLALAFVVFALRPIAHPTLSNTSTVSGTLELCMEAANAEHDVVIRLRDMQDRFYINRGTERGVEPAVWQRKLVGTPVDVIYVNHWSPLDPFSSTHHVAALVAQGDTLYSEF